MARKNKKDGSQVCLFLSFDTRNIIKYGSKVSDTSNSGFVDFLATNWMENYNPENKLKSIEKKEADLIKELEQIKEQKNKAKEDVEKHEYWKRLKQNRKPEAIKAITRFIIEEREPLEIETCAMTWGKNLEIPPVQLLYEAIEKLKSEPNFNKKYLEILNLKGGVNNG
jgi:peroxiredoxin family protein